MVKPFYLKSSEKTSLKTNRLKTIHPKDLKTFATKASVLKRVNSVYLIQMRPTPLQLFLITCNFSRLVILQLIMVCCVDISHKSLEKYVHVRKVQSILVSFNTTRLLLYYWEKKN